MLHSRSSILTKHSDKYISEITNHVQPLFLFFSRRIHAISHRNNNVPGVINCINFKTERKEILKGSVNQTTFFSTVVYSKTEFIY